MCTYKYNVQYFFTSSKNFLFIIFSISTSYVLQKKKITYDFSHPGIVMIHLTYIIFLDYILEHKRKYCLKFKNQSAMVSPKQALKIRFHFYSILTAILYFRFSLNKCLSLIELCFIKLIYCQSEHLTLRIKLNGPYTVSFTHHISRINIPRAWYLQARGHPITHLEYSYLCNDPLL
jgi:hypothetical protein